jgi:hypothetical protein
MRLPPRLGVVKRRKTALQRGQKHRQKPRDGQRKAQNDQRHQPRQKRQKRQQNRQKRGIQHRLKQPPDQKMPYLFSQLHVAGQNARGRRLEHRQGQRQQMRMHRRADPRIEPPAADLHQALAHIAESRVEQHQKHIDRQHRRQRVPGMRGNHAVNHHLHQEGQGKGNEVARHHRHRHAAKQRALLQQRRHEPAQTKGTPCRKFGLAQPRQDQPPRPARLELRLRQEQDALAFARGVKDGGMRPGGQIDGMGKDEPAAVLALAQRRIGRAEPLRRAPSAAADLAAAKARALKGRFKPGGDGALFQRGDFGDRQGDAVVQADQEQAPQRRHLRRAEGDVFLLAGRKRMCHAGKLRQLD